MEDHCVMCGEIIPEGRQVCPLCEKKYGETDGTKGKAVFFHKNRKPKENPPRSIRREAVDAGGGTNHLPPPV